MSTGQSHSVSFSQYVSEKMAEQQQTSLNHRNAAILKSLPKISSNESQDLVVLHNRSSSISTEKVPQ